MIKPDNISLTLEDSQGEADPKLVFIVKHLQKEDPYVGSVSIARSILLEGMLGYTYEMWITLFDDQNDDEYDGTMGINDDDEPRILLELTVKEQVQLPIEEPPVQIPVQEEFKANPIDDSRASKKTVPISEKSYMRGIHNQKDNKKKQPDEVLASRPSTTSANDRKANSNSVGRKKTAEHRLTPNTSAKKIGPKPVPSLADKLPDNLPKSNISKPRLSHRKAVEENDIQRILDANPNKRQNVAFLRQLLDSQLNALATNLKVMQKENCEIETETIQRLQLIDEFG